MRYDIEELSAMRLNNHDHSIREGDLIMPTNHNTRAAYHVIRVFQPEDMPIHMQGGKIETHTVHSVSAINIYEERGSEQLRFIEGEDNTWQTVVWLAGTPSGNAPILVDLNYTNDLTTYIKQKMASPFITFDVLNTLKQLIRLRLRLNRELLHRKAYNMETLPHGIMLFNDNTADPEENYSYKQIREAFEPLLVSAHTVLRLLKIRANIGNEMSNNMVINQLR